jgi:ATP phosphoribosyltransferase regulatory subunit
MPLLPSGLQDILPPYAARERAIMGALLHRFSLFGYAQVAPPLLEFDETLLAGKGAAHAHNIFRVMDPTSQQMMGLRADITPQIERIATGLLKGSVEVARLSYAGQVLRVSPSGLSPLRQLRQAGIEMIGMTHAVHPLEVMTAAIEALDTLGLTTLTLSLSYAGLFDLLFGGCLPDSQAIIQKAIYHKDSGSLPHAMPYRDVTLALMQDDLDTLFARTDLPHATLAPLKHLRDVNAQLQERFPTLAIHTDPLDTEGFDYHTGVCFTLYDTATRQEIGRGGSYDLRETTRGCGMTFYIERLLLSDIATPSDAVQEILPHHTPYADAKLLRDQGIVTLTHYL